MKIICNQCKKVLGYLPALDDGITAQGLCPSCLVEAFVAHLESQKGETDDPKKGSNGNGHSQN